MTSPSEIQSDNVVSIGHGKAIGMTGRSRGCAYGWTVIIQVMTKEKL
jgi:hypothetical protein